MYRATRSFTTKDYDIKYKEILADDFTTQEEINEFLDIGYIEPYDDTLEISENGIYNVDDYKNVDVNVSGSTGFPPDWTELGYTDAPQILIDDFNYSKEVMQNWDASKTFENDTKIAYVPMIDISEITSFYNFFRMCKRLIYIPNLDTSKGTVFQGMFSGCSALISIPNLDTSEGTVFQGMFSGCSILTSIPNLDTSKGTVFQSMFYYCSFLTSIPNLDLSSGNNFQDMFHYCSALTSIPNLDVSNGTNFQTMFSSCSALTSIPNLDTSKGTVFQGMFSYCPALTSIPNLDLSSGNDFSNMFYHCNKLSNESLNNILASLLTATNYTGTKTLKQVGLSSSQSTTCTTLSNWDALSQAGWTTGF